MCALDQANSTIGSENYVIGRKSGYGVEDVRYIKIKEEDIER